jgi:hypothetical protein
MCCPPYRTRSVFAWALVAFAGFCADFRDARAFAGENSEANGPSAKTRPNIVFMLSDDQGWSGTSVRMHPDLATSRSDKLHTPNLERLAARGMRFSEGYAPACVCSPTRIALQTGKNPARLHWTKAAPPEAGHKLVEPRLIKQLADEETTVGELLRSVGYATAHYGKWHIGGGGPGRHGCDEHDGDTGNEHAFQFQDPNPVDIFGMAERAERFMRRNRDAGKPFFIQLSWNALHAADNALRATLSKYKRQAGVADNETADKRVAVAAITEDLDTGSVGCWPQLTNSVWPTTRSSFICPTMGRAVVAFNEARYAEARGACGREACGSRSSWPVRVLQRIHGATSAWWGMTGSRPSANGEAFPPASFRRTSTAAASPGC